MKKKLVAFAVTAAMIVTSAVPAFADWGPAGAQEYPDTNEVVMNSTTLKAGIENIKGDAITNGVADSITVDFNRTEGQFEYIINLTTNKNKTVPFNMAFGDGEVWMGNHGPEETVDVEGIATLTWSFDTTVEGEVFLDLIIDKMNSNADPEVLSIEISTEFETVASTAVNALNTENIQGTDRCVIYQNQIPDRVASVEVIKAKYVGGEWVADKDRHGRVQVVDQPVLGGQYMVNSITLNDGTVIGREDMNDYVTFAWKAVKRNGTPVTITGANTASDVLDLDTSYAATESLEGCYITLEVAAKKESGIFRTYTWGAETEPLALQERIAGEDRYETAMKVADEMKDSNGFETIFVATGTNYADALSATALASRKDAPILLVNAAHEDEVAAYIEKNAANYDAKVYVIGGTKAVSESFVDKIGKFNVEVERLAGANRYATNVEILREYRTVASLADILVASGKNYPDALSASATGMPVLLVGDQLTKAQKDFLATEVNDVKDVSGGTKITYTIKSIKVVGGTAAVSNAVKNELSGKAYVANANQVKRLAGEDRFETNRMVINQLMPYKTSSQYVFVASANDYADALTGGVLAAKNNSPLVLVNDNNTTIAKRLINSIETNNNFDGLVVIGGENAVSNETVQKIA